jgi:hypothetical protein
LDPPANLGTHLAEQQQLVPVLLGDGLRLFDSPGGEPVRLERVSLGTSGQITDLRFRVVKP